MKRFLAAGLACLSFAAFAAPARFITEAQALTRAVPTLATEGMGLSGVKGYRVSVCAESGQTLAGTGNLRAWLYNPDAGLWMRNPALDLAITVTVRCQVFPDVRVAAELEHRVLYANDTVGVSGGTTATMRVDGVRL